MHTVRQVIWLTVPMLEQTDDGGSKHLWNVGKLLPDYTAQHPRLQSSSYSPPWEPETSAGCISVLAYTNYIFFEMQTCSTEFNEPSTGLFKKKYTISKFYFTKTTDAISMSCVRMERKSLRGLISTIWSGASLRLWLLLPVTCCDEYWKSWIIDFTSAASHVGLTSSACKVRK
jgi:hypothetical protein